MDVMTLRRNIITGNHRLPFRERTVIGNPVSFRTNADKPLNELLIPFLPIQQGTGDPSIENERPIVGRTGLNVGRTRKNMLGGMALANAVVSSIPSATIYSDSDFVSFASNAATDHVIVGYGSNNPTIIGFKFKENIQYTFIMAYSKNQKSNPNLRIFYTDGTADYLPSVSELDIKQTKVFVSASGKTIRCFAKSNVGGTTHLYYEESGIFEGVLTAQDFEEWGGTIYPVTFPALGKNLLSGMETGAINQSTGQDETDNTVMRCVGYIPVEHGETYTLGTLASSGNIRFFGYDATKNYLGNAVVRNVTNATYTVGSGTHFIRFQGATERFTGVDLQFEKGESHTAYEPFDNTVYGGTPDAVNGVLTMEWAYANLNSESAWGSYGTGDGFLVYVRKSDMQVGNRLPGYCDMFPSTYSQTGANIRFGADDNVIRIYNINALGITDLSEWKEFIGTSGINVCYPLATPYEIPLSSLPTFVTLIGDNTIWSDTGEDMTVTYLKRG